MMSDTFSIFKIDEEIIDVVSILTNSENLYPKAIYPMKFMTTKCRTTLAKIKSAKALSGEIPLNSDRFRGLV